MNTVRARTVAIELATVRLEGLLRVPRGARGLVLFAHGSGSGRLSPRNTYVAQYLSAFRLATLLFDLLTVQEARIDAVTGAMRFNIALLTDRLAAATAWVRAEPALPDLPLGYFGASTGAAAALAAAARLPYVRAVVSRGGRPDLAGPMLGAVRAATLLIVGGNDRQVLALNRAALAQLRGVARLQVVPGATHLFAEPGALEHVSALAGAWFEQHLCAPAFGRVQREAG